MIRVRKGTAEEMKMRAVGMIARLDPIVMAMQKPIAARNQGDSASGS